MFKTSYLFDFEGAVRKIEVTRVTLLRCIDITKMRVRQEWRAADEIRKFGTNPSHSPDCVNECLNVVEGAFLRRARDIECFIDQLNLEIVTRGEQLLKQHDSLLNTSSRDGKQLVRVLGQVNKKHDDTLMRLRNSYSKTVQRIGDISAPDVLPGDRVDLYSAASDACVDYESYLKEYNDSICVANEFRRNEYVDQMTIILNMLEEVHNIWMDFIKESCMKLLLFEVAHNRNMQYENEKAFKDLERLQSDRTGASDPATYTISDIVFIDPALSVTQPNQYPTNHLPLCDKITAVLIESVWGEAGLDEPFFRTTFREACSRLLFLRILKQQPSGLPSMDALLRLGRILLLLLDFSLSDEDSDTARRVCAIGSSFFAITPEGRKKFIQSQIYHHDIWNKVSFWEDALRIVMAEDTVRRVISDLKSTVLDPNILSDMSLDQFGSYMLMFGLTSSSALDICGKVVDSPQVMQRLADSIRLAKERQDRNVAVLQGDRKS